MRIVTLAAMAAAALALTACESKEDAVAEKQADAIEATGEAKADALEKQANTVTGPASAALDAQANAVEQKADAKADAVEQAAGKKD